MKSILFTLIVCCSTPIVLIAQKEQVEKKYEKLFYKETKVEKDGIKLEISDPVSVVGETKFKLKITNTTNNIILFKPEESTFVIGGKEINPTEKWIFIEPNSSENKVINAKGVGFNEIKNYTFKAEGFYTIQLAEGKIKAEDFKLPASKNDFKAGDFQLNLVKSSKETDATFVKFKCTYLGENFGFVMPSKTAVRMPDGNTYAAANTKDKIVILKRGESDNMTLKWDRMPGGKTNDMQLVEMFITWQDAFVEGIPVKMTGQQISLEFDEAMTIGKNK